MEKRIKEAMDSIKIPEERREEMFDQLLMEAEKEPEPKRNRNGQTGKKICIAAAALLVLVLIREPAETLARRLLFPARDSITGETGIQRVNIGEMGVTQFQKPEDMEPIRRELIEMQREPSGNFVCTSETKLLGNRKQYDFLADMEKELGLSFLKNRKLEEQPLSTTLCVYDQNGLSISIVDAKCTFGEDNSEICMEIIMEMEDTSKEYRYGMNQRSDYQGIYRREDGLFEAVLLQNNQSMGPDWQYWVDSTHGTVMFQHYSQYFAPLNTYGAVFYYDGMRYNIYGAESPETLNEILDNFQVKG